MSRARDMANLGDQAGSGLDASDLTTGTLGNTVQDNITRLGTVTTGTMNNTIGSSATFPAGMVTNVFNYKTDYNEYSNTGTTLKAMVPSNSFSAISGKKYQIITTFNVWPYKTSASDNNWITEWHLYTGTTSRTQGTTTFTGDTDQGKVRIGKYHTVNATSGLNGYQAVTLQGSLTAASTTTYYFHIVSKGLNATSITRIKSDENHPWRTTIFEVQP